MFVVKLLSLNYTIDLQLLEYIDLWLILDYEKH